jgi:hypothetical protein
VLANDVLLVSDANASYRYFAQEAGISHEAVNLSAGIRVNGAFHVQNVNAYHSRLQQWNDSMVWPTTISPTISAGGARSTRDAFRPRNHAARCHGRFSTGNGDIAIPFGTAR